MWGDKGHIVQAPDSDDFGVNRKYFSYPFLPSFHNGNSTNVYKSFIWLQLSYVAS